MSKATENSLHEHATIGQLPEHQSTVGTSFQPGPLSNFTISLTANGTEHLDGTCAYARSNFEPEDWLPPRQVSQQHINALRQDLVGGTTTTHRSPVALDAPDMSTGLDSPPVRRFFMDNDAAESNPFQYYSLWGRHINAHHRLVAMQATTHSSHNHVGNSEGDATSELSESGTIDQARDFNASAHSTWRAQISDSHTPETGGYEELD